MNRPRLSDDNRNLVRAEYQRLATDGVARKTVDHIEQAFAILAPELRPVREKCYPCFHGWLVGKPAQKLPTTPAAGHPSPAPRKQRGVISARKTAPAVSLGSAPNDLTLDDAIAAMCDVLIARITATLDARLDGLLAMRVATAAIKLCPPPAPRTPAVKVDLTKPETLDDTTLRIEVIKARATGDIGRWGKLVAVMKKRSEASNAVEFHSKDSQG